jgi:hypothetical protein
LLANALGLRHQIVPKPRHDPRVEPRFNFGSALFPVFEAYRIDAELCCSRLSVQPSIEAGLADMLPKVVQILGIAWN